MKVKDILILMFTTHIVTIKEQLNQELQFNFYQKCYKILCAFMFEILIYIS